MWTGPGESAPKKRRRFHQPVRSWPQVFGTHMVYGIILPHPPYSPDLAPSDHFLFPNMKTWLGGKRFSSNEEIIAATNEYFEGFDQNYVLEGIKKLEYRYNEYIQLEGGCVKK